jgi:hypothetical protein
METLKKIDLSEYKILIKYDDDDSSLEITILDELEEIIDVINVMNDNVDDDIDPRLN